MNDSMETRVGFLSMDTLRREIEEYITTFTVNGKYCGKLDYLTKHKIIVEYLNQ
jgi:hypothetical protein